MLRSLVIIGLVFAQTSFAQTWITAKTHVERIKKNTSCKAFASNDKKTECACCLIKHSVVNGKPILNAINRCSEDPLCTFAKDANTDIAIATAELQNAKRELQAVTVVNIDKLNNPPQLPEDGILTSEHVEDILKRLRKEGHLSLPHQLISKSHDESPRLLIKSLGDSSKGVFSGQLFSIRFDPYYLHRSKIRGERSEPLYILKETKKGICEIEHLYRVSTSPLKSERPSTTDHVFGIAEPTSPTIARISFDDLHFKLKTDGKYRYFSLLQTAPGRSVHSYLKDFGKIASTKDIDDEEFITTFKKTKVTMYRVGFAVSELHQKYARKRSKYCRDETFVHGDMHSENIFYDDKTGVVTLIDNETFKLSLDRPSSGVNDILEFYMLHTVHTIAHKVARQLTTNQEFGISDDVWHELIRSMINGYLAAYGDLSSVEFVRVFSSFKHEFMMGFSQKHFFESIHHMKDQRHLKRLGFSMRRHKIMHEELHKIFKRTLEDGINKYDFTEPNKPAA